MSRTDDPAQPTQAQATARRGLRDTAARGALVTVGAQLVKMVVQITGVVVLARLLTPGDYGLVAMVTAIIGVAEIFRDFGLSTAAVQSRVLSRGQRDNLFWISTGAGALLTGLVLLCAPLIALLYGRPELVDLARALAVVFLLNGMTSQYRAGLVRQLRFARLAVVEIASPGVGLVVAVVLADRGVGYWALVGQQLTTALALLLLTVLGGRWLPGRPDRSAPMRDLVDFGRHLAGSQLLGYLGNNVDSLVIGTRLGPTSLGLYNRAFQLLMTPLAQCRAPTTTVALPVLTRLKDDAEATDRFVARGQLGLGLTLVVGLGLVIGAADPLTALLLGRSWVGVEPVLRLLAVAGVFQTLAYVGHWVYLAHGLTRELMHYTVLTVTIKVTCILVGSHWGLLGVAYGYALAPAIAWPLSFWWLSTRSTVSVRALFVGAARILIVTVLVAAAAYGASLVSRELPAVGQLGVAVAVAAGCYGLAVLTVPALRRDLFDVLEIARRGSARL